MADHYKQSMYLTFGIMFFVAFAFVTSNMNLFGANQITGLVVSSEDPFLVDASSYGALKKAVEDGKYVTSGSQGYIEVQLDSKTYLVSTRDDVEQGGVMSYISDPQKGVVIAPAPEKDSSGNYKPVEEAVLQPIAYDREWWQGGDNILTEADDAGFSHTVSTKIASDAKATETAKVQTPVVSESANSATAVKDEKAPVDEVKEPVKQPSSDVAGPAPANAEVVKTSIGKTEEEDAADFAAELKVEEKLRNDLQNAAWKAEDSMDTYTTTVDGKKYTLEATGSGWVVKGADGYVDNLGFGFNNGGYEEIKHINDEFVWAQMKGKTYGGDSVQQTGSNKNVDSTSQNSGNEVALGTKRFEWTEAKKGDSISVGGEQYVCLTDVGTDSKDCSYYKDNNGRYERVDLSEISNTMANGVPTYVKQGKEESFIIKDSQGYKTLDIKKEDGTVYLYGLDNDKIALGKDQYMDDGIKATTDDGQYTIYSLGDNDERQYIICKNGAGCSGNFVNGEAFETEDSNGDETDYRIENGYVWEENEDGKIVCQGCPPDVDDGTPKGDRGSSCSGNGDCATGVCDEMIASTGYSECVTQDQADYRDAYYNDVNAMLAETQKWTQYGGAFSNLIFGEDAFSGWREAMDSFFGETVLGQILSGDWEESICHQQFEIDDTQTVLIDLGNGKIQFGMHVEGERTVGIAYEDANGTAVQDNLYKVTYYVYNNNEGPLEFNILFEGGDTQYYYNEWETIEGDSSFDGTARNRIVDYSKMDYNRVCLVLSGDIEDFEGNTQGRVCNQITFHDYSDVTNVEIDVEYDRVGGDNVNPNW